VGGKECPYIDVVHIVSVLGNNFLNVVVTFLFCENGFPPILSVSSTCEHCRRMKNLTEETQKFFIHREKIEHP
jgi:hypothetical protein